MERTSVAAPGQTQIQGVGRVSGHLGSQDAGQGSKEIEGGASEVPADIEAGGEPHKESKLQGLDGAGSRAARKDEPRLRPPAERSNKMARKNTALFRETQQVFSSSSNKPLKAIHFNVAPSEQHAAANSKPQA